MNLKELLPRLQHPIGAKGGYLAHCPAHEDRIPSLSATEKNGKILLHCHAGCSFDSIVKALGLTAADLFTESALREKKAKREPEAVYRYTDENGTLLFEVMRFPGKQFRQRRPDGQGGWSWKLDGTRRVLYRLPEVLKSKSVLVCEGEKDIETALDLDFTATCNPHGAGKWRPEHAKCLQGKRVAIIADADQPGRAHAAHVAGSLFGKAEVLKVLELPGAKDLSEWVERGGTREALLDLIGAAQEWNPTGGSQTLDAVYGFITRFVSLSEAQARVVALWVAHTHSFDAADCTPYLSVNSAEKQSGKTRLLEVLELLVSKPWLTGRVTAPVLARKIDDKEPTLLLDESDTAFGSDEKYAEALRGSLNTGYRRGGASSVCVGQGANMSYKDFATFCPKAIAGIGKLPDTVADRSIPIRLKRAERGKVERFRRREVEPEASGMSAKLSAWCGENLEKLREARPEIPSQLSDRQADVSEPLLAVANLAGGDWPQEARRALVQLCAKAQADDESPRVQLLRDIKDVFEHNETDELTSTSVVEELVKIETSPWAEWSKGKPLSAAKLARLLKPFEVYPRPLQNGQARGYRLAEFQDAFTRYLPPDSPLPPLESVKVSEMQCSCASNANLKVSNEPSSDTSENAVSPNNHAGSRHFDTLKPEIKGNSESRQAEKGIGARVLEGRF